MSGIIKGDMDNFVGLNYKLELDHFAKFGQMCDIGAIAFGLLK